MCRKFSAACHPAFDTAKPFLDKRSEIQSRHARSLATFCAELEQMPKSEPTDWLALGKGLTRGRKNRHGTIALGKKKRFRHMGHIVPGKRININSRGPGRHVGHRHPGWRGKAGRRYSGQNQGDYETVLRIPLHTIEYRKQTRRSKSYLCLF